MRFYVFWQNLSVVLNIISNSIFCLHFDWIFLKKSQEIFSCYLAENDKLMSSWHKNKWVLLVRYQMNSWTSSCHSFKSLTWLPGEQECVPPRTQPKVDCSLGGRSPGWWASWPRPRRSWGRPRPGWGRPRPRPCRRTAKSSQSRAAGAGTVNPSDQVRSSDFIRFRG